MGDEIGSLEVGKRADIVVIDTDRRRVHPAVARPRAAVVWASDGRAVRRGRGERGGSSCATARASRSITTSCGRPRWPPATACSPPPASPPTACGPDLTNTPSDPDPSRGEPGSRHARKPARMIANPGCNRRDP